MSRKIQIISAPSILGLRPAGVETLSEVIMNTGRLDKLASIEDRIDVPTLNSDYNTVRDAETKCLNPKAIYNFSKRLIPLVAKQIDDSVFPLVLGGDCTILIGIMPALRSKGNFGLIFIDAHADFYQPDKSPTGEVADMDLAIVTGRGPDILTNIDGLSPFVRDENIIHLGQRDAEEARKYDSQDIKKTAIKVFDFLSISSSGIDYVLAEVINHMNKLNVDGFWIHFDTDVISDDENPAVDYRLPGGLTFKETEYLLIGLLRTGRITGLTVTIFNPVLDEGGKVAVKIADCLASALAEVTQ